ncbi:MAG TPA: hypothetical protein V6C69_11955 [Trichormus sp.]|jgi:hypothetical protein
MNHMFARSKSGKEPVAADGACKGVARQDSGANIDSIAQEAADNAN